MALKNLSFLRFMYSGDTDTGNIDIKTGEMFDPKRQGKGANLASTGLLQQYGYEDIYELLKISQELVQRYKDYEDMDDDSIISSAFNIYADDVTQLDYHNKSTIWVESMDDVLADNISDLLLNRLKIEDNIWEMARTLAKYGNDFEKIDYDDTMVKGLDFIAPALVRRYEFNGKTAFAIRGDGRFDYKDSEIIGNASETRIYKDALLLEGWEMIHMRLRTKNRGSRYGFGVAEGSRSSWKRLAMLEEITLLYKLTRAPQRYVFYVRTGNKPLKEAIAMLKEYQMAFRKKKVVNQSTGRIDFKNNPLSAQEDIWIPLMDGKDPTRIENFPSVDYQSLDELNYFRDKLFAGLNVPKRFLTYDENADSRTAGSNDDIRFARNVLRLQRELILGLNKVVGVDYALRGVDISKLEYKIKMAVPSTAFEIAQLEVENTKVALAAQYNEFVSKEWILTRILGLSESEAKKILKKKTKEMGDELSAQQAALNAGGEGAVEYESKNDYFKSKKYALAEQKMDKKLNEILEGNVINNKKFNAIKKLIYETRNMMVGLNLNGKNNGSHRYMTDDDSESFDLNRYM